MFRRRDNLIMQLSCQLADSRAREAALRERLTWYQTVVGETPRPELRIAGEKACAIPTVSARKLGDKAAR